MCMRYAYVCYASLLYMKYSTHPLNIVKGGKDKEIGAPILKS